MGKYLMALDAGIGGGRCLITDTQGKEAAQAYEEWHYHYPADVPEAAEFDAGEFWTTMCRVIRRALDENNIPPEEIVALSATCMREGFLLLDATGEALYAAPPFDGRARQYNAHLAEERGEEIYETTGHWPAHLHAIGRLLWLKEQRPRLWDRVKYLLQINEWLLYRLSGERTGEPSDGCALVLLDIHRRDWAWGLIESLGLPREIFPPMRSAGERLGEVTREAAEETGLKAGTPVIVGGADSQCGLVGTGAIRPGQITAVAGTTTPILMVTSGATLDPQMRTWTRCHAVPDAWCLESNAAITGIVYRWLRDTLCELEKATEDKVGIDAYELMNRRAATVPPGARGVTLIGSSLMDARHIESVFSGATIFGLDMMRPERAGKPEIIRAALESVCYAVRGNCEILEEVSGLKLDALHICGGQTRSKLWVQMQADILGVPLLVSGFEEATALGTIICAGVGSGDYKSFSEATELLTHFTTIEPRPEVHSEYQPFYERWRALYRWRSELPAELCHGSRV
jgi:autoinducer 2 (AI-2) kinase